MIDGERTVRTLGTPGTAQRRVRSTCTAQSSVPGRTSARSAGPARPAKSAGPPPACGAGQARRDVSGRMRRRLASNSMPRVSRALVSSAHLGTPVEPVGQDDGLPERQQEGGQRGGDDVAQEVCKPGVCREQGRRGVEVGKGREPGERRCCGARTQGRRGMAACKAVARGPSGTHPSRTSLSTARRCWCRRRRRRWCRRCPQTGRWGCSGAQGVGRGKAGAGQGGGGVGGGTCGQPGLSSKEQRRAAKRALVLTSAA